MRELVGCVSLIDQMPNGDALTRAEAAFEYWFQSACMDLRRSVHESCPFSIQFCTWDNCRCPYWTDCPHSFHICEENEQEKVTEYPTENLRSPTMNGRTCWPSISFWDFDTWWSDIVGNWCPSVRAKGKSNIESIFNWKISVSHQLFFRNINILWRRRERGGETRARAAETRGKKKCQEITGRKIARILWHKQTRHGTRRMNKDNRLERTQNICDADSSVVRVRRLARATGKNSREKEKGWRKENEKKNIDFEGNRSFSLFKIGIVSCWEWLWVLIHDCFCVYQSNLQCVIRDDVE